MTIFPLYERFPIIKETILELAYDNNCINRYSSEEKVLRNSYEIVMAESSLEAHAAELAALSEQDFIELLTGESELIKSTPALEDFLLRVFEGLA